MEAAGGCTDCRKHVGSAQGSAVDALSDN